MGVSVTLSGLCIIAVLPHILDCQSDCRNKYVKILLQMGENINQNNGGKCNFVRPVYFSRITSYIRLSIRLQK